MAVSVAVGLKGGTGELQALEWGSAEAADLQYAQSAQNNKVTQTP